jgi:hypothetical protein
MHQRQYFSLRPILLPLIAAFAMISMGNNALADGDNRASRTPLLPKYQQECTACHMAYPPGMLPAVSWPRIMNNLQRHYGTDASVDAATLKELSVWLKANAGTYKRVSEAPPDDRITRSAWFLRKHNEREVAPAIWKLAAVKSAANCTACHTQADKGSFSEREIRLPH